MSNVRTLDDYKDDVSTPLNGNDDVSQTPRSRPAQLFNLMFPSISFKTLNMLVVVICIGLYIATNIYSSDTLFIPSNYSLFMFGANFPWSIRGGQVYRLVSAAFLHLSLGHIFINVFFLLRLGFRVEKKYGSFKYAFIFLTTCIAGNLLSATCTLCGNVPKAGASVPIFGFIGLSLAEIFLIWEQIQNKERVLLDLVSFALINIMLSVSKGGFGIDHIGHFGGLCTGVVVGIILNNNLEQLPRHYKIYETLSYAFLAIFFASLIPVLFLRTCSQVPLSNI